MSCTSPTTGGPYGAWLSMLSKPTQFSEHHKYCRLCEEGGTLEKDFYPPLMKAANTVLDVMSRSNFKGIPSEKRQYYHVNDPNHVKGGVMNKKGLSPDLVLLHNDRPRPCLASNRSLHWANPLHCQGHSCSLANSQATLYGLGVPH